MNSEPHTSVLLQESMLGLEIKTDGIYIDATFGRGGHSKAILDRLGPEGQLLVFDKDPAAVAVAKAMDDSRLTIINDSFATLGEVVKEKNWLGKVDGILFDLGVSSPQLDEAERGFSFRQDGPLDMRMDPLHGESLQQKLVTTTAEEIASVLWRFGEERFSRRIAKKIIEEQEKQPLTRTKQLADLIASCIPHEKRIHPATRSFQAFRIWVNNELEDLEQALVACLDALSVKGRLCVVSFHSLEDRIVKQFMRKHSQGERLPSYLPIQNAQLSRILKTVGKAIKPGEQELRENVRARSATLRIAEKL